MHVKHIKIKYLFKITFSVSPLTESPCSMLDVFLYFVRVV